MNEQDLVLLGRLAVALAVGLLIGMERGWSQREMKEGQRVAGIRTFALVAVLGALAALLGQQLGGWVIGIFAAGFSVFLILAQRHALARRDDHGITTLVAALITFCLGVMAVLGQVALAGAVGVITALLLGTKVQLHGLVKGLSQAEVLAVLKLLVMSLVLLPLLPNQGYGPWQALNPYQLWWMVILVAAISSAGHFTMRFLGGQRGLLLTALLGGLVSSTAVTLAFAKKARDDKAAAPWLAAGILAACGTVFPRLLLVIFLLSEPLALRLAPPLGAAALVTYGAAAFVWRRGRAQQAAVTLQAGNPFELLPALKFGLLLATIMLLSKGLPLWLGDSGHILLAAAAGITDVDAIALSYGTQAQENTLPLAFAALAILTAVFSNTVVKATLAAVVGRRALAVPVTLGLAAGMLAGGLALVLAP